MAFEFVDPVGQGALGCSLTRGLDGAHCAWVATPAGDGGRRQVHDQAPVVSIDGLDVPSQVAPLHVLHPTTARKGAITERKPLHPLQTRVMNEPRTEAHDEEATMTDYRETHRILTSELPGVTHEDIDEAICWLNEQGPEHDEDELNLTAAELDLLRDFLRAPQRDDTGQKASDLIFDGEGLRARGGLVYFG
jgi:hypothetical protein